MINRDLPCLKCQYNLRGLSPDGLCPECGHSIRDSINESHKWRPGLAVYVSLEILCGVLAALSLGSAHSFWVELQYRPAFPTSMMPLYGPATGCAASLLGLAILLRRQRLRWAVWCLAIGLIATLAGVLNPYCWE